METTVAKNVNTLLGKEKIMSLTARQIAQKIVNDLAADISDRKGIGDEWYQIDDDVKQKLLLLWLDTVEEHVKHYHGEPDGIS